MKKTNREFDFRIVQRNDNSFFIQRYFKKVSVKGMWFWKKEIITYEWKAVDIFGWDIIVLTYPMFANVEDIAEFETKEDAEKWIKDFKKYPIIHDIDGNIKDKRHGK